MFQSQQTRDLEPEQKPAVKNALTQLLTNPSLIYNTWQMTFPGTI